MENPQGCQEKAGSRMKKKLECSASEAEKSSEKLAAALRSTVMTVEELSEGLLAVGRAMLKRYRWATVQSGQVRLLAANDDGP